MLGEVQEHDDILVCRLLASKLTLVHRRLWPAVAALAQTGALPAAATARVRQVHTSSGKHINQETPFPQWLPPEVATAAAALDPDRARAALRL